MHSPPPVVRASGCLSLGPSNVGSFPSCKVRDLFLKGQLGLFLLLSETTCYVRISWGLLGISASGGTAVKHGSMHRSIAWKPPWSHATAARIKREGSEGELHGRHPTRAHRVLFVAPLRGQKLGSRCPCRHLCHHPSVRRWGAQRPIGTELAFFCPGGAR